VSGFLECILPIIWALTIFGIGFIFAIVIHAPEKCGLAEPGDVDVNS
jgi:hypothetical protein